MNLLKFINRKTNQSRSEIMRPSNTRLFLALMTVLVVLIYIIPTVSMYPEETRSVSLSSEVSLASNSGYISQNADLTNSAYEEGDFQCTAVLVGKEASADGSVMVAHNEDDSGKVVDVLFVNPRNTPFRLLGYFGVRLTNGTWVYRELDTPLLVPVPKEMHAFWGAVMPGIAFSGRYVNEYGVVIFSNSGVASREDKPELVQGGIRDLLRLLVIQQAKTAREAVKLIGYYVETYGYGAPARNYIIADPNEIWVVNVVYGKHWVAQRVPDDSVVVIPNYLVIREVNLSDTENFMGSKDLIEYAIKRGWYDPSRDGVFDFAKAYGTPANQASVGNIYRHQTALYYITGRVYPTSYLPFSVKPQKKLTPQDLMYILRQVNHAAVDQVKYASSLPGSFHRNLPIRPIAPWHNQDAWVVQLRSWLPPIIGVVTWRAANMVDENVFVPIYLGVIYSDFPAPYKFADPNKIDLNSAYWAFRVFSNFVDLDYQGKMPTVTSYQKTVEEEFFKMQPYIEEQALKIYNELGAEYAGKYLAMYTSGALMKVYTDILEMIRSWQSGG